MYLKNLIPAAPFEYKFADTEFAAKFAAETRIGQLSTFFAVLAIFISCLGLFGLASFVAEQRTKKSVCVKYWVHPYLIYGECCRRIL